jgi:hypothetical protein
MSLAATLVATLTLGQQNSSGDPFPSSSASIPFATCPDPKSYAVIAQGSFTVNSADDYVTIPGIGDAGPVTQGTLLYLKTVDPLLVRTTTYNPNGNVVAVSPIYGVMLLEFDPAQYLVLLEVEGAGVIEYAVTGTV